METLLNKRKQEEKEYFNKTKNDEAIEKWTKWMKEKETEKKDFTLYENLDFVVDEKMEKRIKERCDKYANLGINPYGGMTLDTASKEELKLCDEECKYKTQKRIHELNIIKKQDAELMKDGYKPIVFKEYTDKEKEELQEWKKTMKDENKQKEQQQKQRRCVYTGAFKEDKTNKEEKEKEDKLRKQGKYEPILKEFTEKEKEEFIEWIKKPPIILNLYENIV